MAIRLRIHGHVQGVGYRGWLVGQARALDVDGWVRNRADGTVEALIAGSEMDEQTLIQRCQAGPWLARVERIEQALETTPPASGFRQWPSL